MPNHYLFTNRKRTNTSTKALSLFILEGVVIEVVETVHHSSTANNDPCSQVLKFTMWIKEVDTTVRIFRKLTHRYDITCKIRNMNRTDFRVIFFRNFDRSFSCNGWKFSVCNSNFFITRHRYIGMKNMGEICHMIGSTRINDPRRWTRTRESTRVATCLRNTRSTRLWIGF